MTLGEKIRVLRQQAELSQSQLAQQLHVSRAAVAKWENENGIPDVENLKALAVYFRCDVDTLLDENREIENVLVQADQSELIKSYCCKDCVRCPEYQAGNCPGCSNEAGDLIHDNCDIAACCRRFHYLSCANCTMNTDCETLTKRSQMPQLSEKEKKREYETRRCKASYLRTYVCAHFWLLIPSVVQSIVGGLLAVKPLPIVKYIGIALTMLHTVAKFYIMLRMSKVEAGFRKTGWLILAVALLDVPTTLFYGDDMKLWISELLVLPALCLAMYATYYECCSYSSLMKIFDAELSETWKHVTMLYIFSYVGAFCCLVLTKLLPLLGSLLFFACCIGAIIANVLIHVYRCRSAKEISVYC